MPARRARIRRCARRLGRRYPDVRAWAPLTLHIRHVAMIGGIGVRTAARAWLITISTLNGLAGLICGSLLIARPDGGLLMATDLLPVVRALPLGGIFFRDLFWIGVAMFLALGVANVVATTMLVRRHARQYEFALAAAVLLMCWCAFELVFMFNFAAVGYFVVGIISALSAGWLLRNREESAGSLGGSRVEPLNG